MSTLKVNNVTDLGDDAIVTDGALVGAGKILQVVQAVKTDTFTTASTSFEDVTGLTVTITPTSSTSKILILAFVEFSQTVISSAFFRLVRDATPLAVGDTSSNRTSALFGGTGDRTNVGFDMNSASPMLLDSPSTTSAVVYRVQGRRGGGGIATVNRYGLDGDSADSARTVSSITVMEVAG